jgi:hypothetical protein
MTSIIWVVSVLAVVTVAQFSFFPNNTLVVFDIISTGSRIAMKAPINCDSYILALATADYHHSLDNDTIQESVCAVGCSLALSKYHNSVTSACAQDAMSWDGIPATYFGDLVWAYFNGSCLRDYTNGMWCRG